MAQQQQERQQYNREEDYLQAQRALVESIEVGRATLEQAHQQGEQLDRTEQMADETQYKLDKAGRMLRGMTWSGWIANKFSRDVVAPDTTATAAASSVAASYEQPSLPEACQNAAQSLQNYHANLQVLESCESAEQRETFAPICRDLFHAAQKQIRELSQTDQEAYARQFQSDLDKLEQRQNRAMELIGPKKTLRGEKSDLLSSQSASNAAPGETKSKPHDPILEQQNEHLDMISSGLGELGLVAQSLNSAVGQQNETMDRMDGKADSIVEKSKMVTRRADRLIQKKSWTPVKPTFASHVSIRHISSGRYLAVMNREIVLLPTFHKETAVFGLWKRQGEIFGLQHSDSRRWMGQNVFGVLACSSSSFGRREEWETADDDWTNTRLLCASAGWGAGGYLQVRDKALAIGGCSVEERKRADLWCIKEYVDE